MILWYMQNAPVTEAAAVNTLDVLEICSTLLSTLVKAKPWLQEKNMIRPTFYDATHDILQMSVEAVYLICKACVPGGVSQLK